MKNPLAIALGAFLVLSAAVGYLLPRLAPASPRRSSVQTPRFRLPAAQVPPPLVGCLYSVDNSDGGFRVVKVLAVDNRAIHVRLFGNHFPARPSQLSADILDLKPADGYEGPGFAHLAVTRGVFIAWEPQFIRATGAPTAEELTGATGWQQEPGVLGE